MSNWINWLILAGIVVMLELFTGTFYLLMIAIGLVAGALAAWSGWPVSVQLIVAAIVGSAATFGLRRSHFGLHHKVEATRDPNVNLDIGQTIQVSKWLSDSAGTYTARAMHRGAQWDVKFSGAQEPLPGIYNIVEILGSQLIVDRPSPKT